MNDARLARCGTVLLLLLGVVPAQPLLFEYIGQRQEDQVGTAVSGAGDVDGDGFADVIAGVPGDDTNGADAGAAIVLSGRDASILWTFYGDAAGDRLGRSVGGAGDVNGDGLSDVIAGAPGDDENGNASGSARVFSGADGSVLYTFFGDGPGDEFGGAVGGGGDVNGDGYSDVIAGAPNDDNTGANAGSVRVMSGRDGAALWAFDGDGAGDKLGWSVGMAGDFDGDGQVDAIAGAPLDDDGGNNAGRAFVFSGASGARLASIDGAAADDALGWAVGGAGDVDGDGLADVIVGAPHADANGRSCGAVRVHAGPAGALLYTFDGDAAGDTLGWSVGGAGDVDGDGRGDLLAGAPLGDRGVLNSGDARIWSGADGRLLLAVGGDETGLTFGWAVAGAGDVDGNGFDDIVVGAPRDSRGALLGGAARVFGRRPWDRLVLRETKNPALAGANLAIALAKVGDVNGDGFDDYAAGAPWDFGTLGTVRVWSGWDHSLLQTFTGTGLNINFGIRVGPAGDLDRDGFGDVIVGAIHDDTVFQDSGAASVFSGRDGHMLLNVFGTQFRSHLGTAVGTIGDVNGDGVDDLFLGLGVQHAEDGEVWVVSGANGQRIWAVRGPSDSWFGWSGAALGDLDGDGFTDFVVGAPEAISGGPGFARVMSGASGATIRELPGVAPGDLFGWVCNPAGDVDRDGVPDIIVGGYQHDPAGRSDAGMARVYSGADGAMLYHLEGEAAGDLFGSGVAAAGDLDGDGVDDFLVGAPGTSPGVITGAGSFYAYSGATGRVLQRVDSWAVGDGAGRALAGLGDLDGDGYGEVIVGVPYADDPDIDAGVVRVYASRTKSDPGVFRTYGAGCPGSNGNLPGIAAGRPLLGRAFVANLAAAAPSAPVFLGIDFTAQRLPLGVLGAPACTLLALPMAALGTATDPSGRASVGLPIPASTSVLGATVFVQWIVVDPPANPLGLVLSNAGRGVVGR